MATARQKLIDFDRARQLRLMSGVVIEVPAGIATSSATMRAALRELDDMIGSKEGFRVKLETLATRLGLSRATTQRAVRALRELGVVDVVRTGRSSLYGIAWEVVADRQPGSAMMHQMRHNDASDGSRMMHQMHHHDASTIPPRSTDQILPPPPTGPAAASGWHTPPVDRPARAAATPDDSDWAAAAADLRNCGVRAVWHAIETAKQRGIPPKYVRDLCVAWRSRSSDCSAGLIVSRIATDPPDADAAAGWPDCASATAGRYAVDQTTAVELVRSRVLAECRRRGLSTDDATVNMFVQRQLELQGQET